MSQTGFRPKEGLRIVGAIAAKDIADALKNKTILSIVLGMGMMILSAQVFPFLVQMSATPRLVVYDAGSSATGESQLVTMLRRDGVYNLSVVDAQEQLEDLLLDMNAEVLGLIIPADFDQVVDAGGQPHLGGAVLWSKRSAAGELAAEMEQYLQGLTGRPVSVDVEGHIVYPPAEGGGSMGMVATIMVLILIAIGLFLVPYLIMEEKQMHTMDALLVSPASATHIVIGKALAGLVYCLTAAAVVLALNASAVTHWGIAIMAVLGGAMLAVPMGLVIGSLFKSPQHMALLVFAPAIALMLPVFLVALGSSLPSSIAWLLPWLPTVALSKLFLLSFSDQATPAMVLRTLAIVLAWALPVYAVVIWAVRRSDR